MIIKYKRQPETTLPIQSLFAAVYPVDIQSTKKGRLFTFPLSNFFLWFFRIYIKTKTISFFLGPSVYTSIYSQFFLSSPFIKKILAAILGTKIMIISPLSWFHSRSKVFPLFLSQLWWCLLPQSLFIFFSLSSLILSPVWWPSTVNDCIKRKK